MLRETATPTDAITPAGGNSYWSEFRLHWRPTLAATAGLSAGMSLNAYINSVFGPYLLSAFSWNKAQFALMGTLSLLTRGCIPFVGRMADVYGVRRVAAVGIVAFPLSLLLLASMTGDIRAYYAITVLQIVL